MDNTDNHKARLSAAEKERFRDLANNIIERQSQSTILSESEREDFLYLLSKLELYPRTRQQIIESSKSTQTAIRIFSFLSVYILLIGVSVAIASVLNARAVFLVYAVLGATSLSVMIIGYAMGKVGRGMYIIVSIVVFAIGAFLYHLIDFIIALIAL